MEWLHLCANELTPIQVGQERIRTIADGKSFGEVVSVYTHDRPECWAGARAYPANLDEVKARFDKEGKPI